MDKINGIIVSGKVYVAVKYAAHEHSGCRGCDFYIQHGCMSPKLLCRVFEADTTNKYIFRYSQELTDKINGKPKKQKRMCLRDKNKVCDLCHECDKDISQPNY